MKIGYIRVSTAEQNEARQEVLMEQLGVERVFIDKQTGTNTNRPALKELMEFVRDGDSVVVESISRFARSASDLLILVNALTEKKVNFVSQKENMDFSTPVGKAILGIFGSIYELEVSNLKTRQAEGIAIAKAQGKYLGRKPITHPDFEKVVKIWRKGEITAVEAMKRLGGMKPTTFYRKVKEYENR
jgi:DNA invertase Pin-like site-specific DNA recombinase